MSKPRIRVPKGAEVQQERGAGERLFYGAVALGTGFCAIAATASGQVLVGIGFGSVAYVAGTTALSKYRKMN